MLKWLRGFLAGVWFLRPNREELELLTKEQLRELVERECEKIEPSYIRGHVHRVIDSKVERYVVAHLSLAADRVMRVQLEDLLRSLDLKPRVEAAARQAIEDALKRADFCRASMEEAARRTIEAVLANAEVKVDSLESYVFRALGRMIREKTRGRPSR